MGELQNGKVFQSPHVSALPRTQEMTRVRNCWQGLSVSNLSSRPASLPQRKVSTGKFLKSKWKGKGFPCWLFEETGIESIRESFVWRERTLRKRNLSLSKFSVVGRNARQLQAYKKITSNHSVWQSFIWGEAPWTETRTSCTLWAPRTTQPSTHSSLAQFQTFLIGQKLFREGPDRCPNRNEPFLSSRGVEFN